MRIYICDDNELDTARLRRMVTTYAQRFGCALAIKTFVGAEPLLAELTGGEARPDLLFMDIYMEGLNGVQALERLRSVCETPFPVIFNTSSGNHAIEAFRLHAAGYLHKPYTQEDFDHAMTRVESLFAAWGRTLNVWVREQESYQKIYVEDIFYIESSGRGTLLYVGGESSRTGACARLRASNGLTGAACPVSSRLSLQECREKLAEEKDFCDCGRSYLVNLNHAVEMAEYGLRMECGDIIPTPERLRPAVAQRLENWRQYGGSLSL